MQPIPRPRRDSPKRDHLVDTAWKLFYRDGYHAVGIDTILAEAGVAKMTLYNHFSSKEDLIVAVLQWRHRTFFDSMQAGIEAAGRVPMKRLLAVFDWLEDWLGSAGFNGCAFIRAVAEYPRADERPHQVAASHKEAVTQTLVTLCREAELREPAQLGRQLALLIEGAIVTAHTFGPGRVGKDTRDAAKRIIAAASL